MDILGYTLTGTLEAVAITAAILVEALVLYVAYEGATRAATRVYENAQDGSGEANQQ